MYVEDLVIFLADKMSRITANEWNISFVESLHFQVSNDRPISTAQNKVFLDLVKKFRTSIENLDNGLIPYFQQHLNNLIENPQYKNIPYETIIIPKEVRYLGENKLGFRFKIQSEILNDIKLIKDKYQSKTGSPVFNRQLKIWIVPVTSYTLDKIIELIAKHNFDFDDAVADYLTLCTNSKDKPSTFVLDPESGKIVANICDNKVLMNWIQFVLFGEPI